MFLNKMKTISLRIVWFVVFGMFFLNACTEDEDILPVNDQKTITTFEITFLPKSGGSPTTLKWQDLDGDGGNPPEITGGTFLADTDYSATMQLLNETTSENITLEILEQNNEHQFFFEYGSLFSNFAYEDKDGNDFPVGLATSWTTASVGSGSFKVILRHHPDKSASGVTTGNSANAGGKTDIEVEFPITIE